MSFERLLTNWKWSLKWKLVSIFVAIVLSNLVVIGYFVNKHVTSAIESDDIKLSRLVLRQANLNITRYLQDYEHFMMTLGTSQELQNWTNLSTDNMLVESIVPFFTIEKSYIRPFYNSHPELVSVDLYNAHGNEVWFSPTYAVRYGYSLGKQAWFGKLPVGTMDVMFEESPMYMDARLSPIPIPVISMVQRFGYNGPTYVKIDIQPTLLQNILNEINLVKDRTGFIIDASGRIVAHTQKEKLLSQLDERIINRMDGEPAGAFVTPDMEIVIYEKIAGTNWRSVIILPYDQIAGSIYAIRTAMIVTTVLCLIVSVLLIVVVSSSVTNRLIRIRQTMKQTGQGQIDVPVPVEGHDEISDLAASYNTMLEDLQLHIKRLAESRLAEQQSALFSLQSQIDAHFLYNTLEIINSMATKIKHEEIERITISLAHMFRYTANYKQTEVTIQGELQHLLRYLHIIKIRYGDLFTYDLDVDDVCLDARCLKVILQPIAENALKHGLETTGRNLHLTVRIHLIESRFVQITVSDNGKGFARHRLEELNEQLNSSELQYSNFQRIGLLNIHYRLTTRYGASQAGLKINNNESHGAVIRLVFPYEAEQVGKGDKH